MKQTADTDDIKISVELKTILKIQGNRILTHLLSKRGRKYVFTTGYFPESKFHLNYFIFIRK
jgi:hypothetical protein